MIIKENFNLTSLNTFGVAAKARYYGVFSSVEELKGGLEEARFSGLSRLILGGGSNILFLSDFEGVVLHNQILGVELVSETSEHALVRVGGGVIWHDFVEQSLSQNWTGLENLALIPGSVGAAPIQNIGAYGVEVKDLIDRVEVFDTISKQKIFFDSQQCQFGYRDSVFKRDSHRQLIITAVEFKLSKRPQIKTHYGVIASELQRLGITSPTPRAIADVVMAIRRTKLPDPQRLGNAGSFFKNPVIPRSLFESLQNVYPQMPSYPAESTEAIKLAAGWLIEQAGLKGYRQGPCGVHKDQALVLVNYGGATGTEILALSEKVQDAVYAKFQIRLEREVNLVPLGGKVQ